MAHLTAIKELPKESRFLIGDKFRCFNVGMNVAPENDYYDYLLSYAPWQPEHVMLINITDKNSKAGFAFLALLEIDRSASPAGVTVETLINMVDDGITRWFLIRD
ncbi:MAG: hypothetical protein GC181_06335 [Bacteroidetes bacterium]|nr:hypothetical protein [Bacteroidota bacterium]